VDVLFVLAAEQPGPFLQWALSDSPLQAALASDAVLLSRHQYISLVETACGRAAREHRSIALAALRRWMREPDLNVRLRAAVALRKLVNDANAFDALLEVFDEAHTPELRRDAINHLRPVPERKARDVVKRLLECLDIPTDAWKLSFDGLQRAALEALGDAALFQSCDEDIAAFLEVRIGQVVDVDRAIVRCTLCAINAIQAGAPGFSRLIAMVARCLENQDERTEEAVVELAFGSSMRSRMLRLRFAPCLRQARFGNRRSNLHFS
jgi:hypothetical protein